MVSGVGSKAGGAALGSVLSAFGLRDDNDLLREDIANIRQALNELGKQVTQLQGQVERAGFSTLVYQSNRTIGELDDAMSQLALLANLPASDPTKAASARTVVDYIARTTTLRISSACYAPPSRTSGSEIRSAQQSVGIGNPIAGGAVQGHDSGGGVPAGDSPTRQSPLRCRTDAGVLRGLRQGLEDTHGRRARHAIGALASAGIVEIQN